jgi:hypothetical protein
MGNSLASSAGLKLKLEAFGNKVLRKIFGTKKYGLRDLHNEEFRHQIRTVKIWKRRWVVRLGWKK